MSSALKTSRRMSKSERESNISFDKEVSSSGVQSEFIWPEWSDADINAEKWGTSLEGGKSAGKKKKSPRKEKKGKGKSRTPSPESKVIEIEQFEDLYPVFLPWSIRTTEAISWVRPNKIFPDLKLVVHSDSAPTCPDLISSNRNLLKSDFLRSFISSIHILTYIGRMYPFETEWQTTHFSFYTAPWQPWHHIYSVGRAGGNAQHNPVANNLGKYAVRLFWLGCWRKILVDDRYPVHDGQPLLPTSTIENDKEHELWPILLMKALMKIANLTWTDQEDLADFDIISCLTGWAVQKISVQGLDVSEKWDICSNYSDHFDWDKAKLIEEPVLPTEEPTTKKEKKKKKEPKGGKSKKGAKVADLPQKNEIAFHLVASICDLRDYVDILDDISPCWNHEFLLEATRSIPLVKQVTDITNEKDICEAFLQLCEYFRKISSIDSKRSNLKKLLLKEEQRTILLLLPLPEVSKRTHRKLAIKLPQWKRFRWLDWAIAHGIWEADYTLENKRFIKIVSSMRKVNDENTLADMETTYKEKCIKTSVETFQKYMEEREAQSAGKMNKKLPASPKKEKKEKKSPKSPKTPKVDKFVDPSIWCNFINIGEYITYLSIYIKPSSFKTRYVLTNFKINGPPIQSKTSKKNKDFDMILCENLLQKQRNDTIYLFTDSIDYGLTVFTLAHIGNDFPKCRKNSKHLIPIQPECKKAVCILGKCIDDECSCRKNLSNEADPLNFIDNRRTANIIVENFDWTSKQTGDTNMFLKTYGTSSLFYNFPKGRYIKRIWISAEPAFCLHVLSDDNFVKVGKCDEILERMVMESEILTETCFQVCSAFGNLVRYFATTEYPAALKSFYKSYLPEEKLNKQQMATIHECFLNELKVLVINEYPEMNYYDFGKAIRTLLLSPNFILPYSHEYFPYTPKMSSTEIICRCVDPDEITEKAIELAAIKIQSCYRMFRIRQMMKLHNIQSPGLHSIIECMKTIYVDFFSSKNREAQCLKLLRSMMISDEIKHLTHYYSFYRDLSSVVDIKQFNGDVNEGKYAKYTPLIRRNFYCNSDSPVYLRPYMFTTLPSCIVRIFNNDTGDEIDRHTNNALVHAYEKNINGYCLLAYGLMSPQPSSPTKTYSWKLIVVMQKNLLTSDFEIDTNANSLMKLQGAYIPNLDNLVCLFKVRISQTSGCTFHVQSSSPTAELKMECISKDGDVIAEAYGLSLVMIPNVNLLKDNDENFDASAPEFVQEEKQTKLLKKNKGQRRASSKSLYAMMKDRKRPVEREKSQISIASSSHSTSTSKKKIPSLDFQEYTVRVTVLQDSWPLTTKEWQAVQKWRLLSNVEQDLFKVDSSSVGRKQIFTPRRISKEKEAILPSPYWIFQGCGDSQKQMFITIDSKRVDDIKNMKRKLIQADPDRYFHGKQARQQLLDYLYIKWTPPKSPEENEGISPSDQTILTRINNAVEEIANKDLSQDIQLDSENVSQPKVPCHKCKKEIDESTLRYIQAPEDRDKMLPVFDVNRYDEREIVYRWPIDSQRELQIISEIYSELEEFKKQNLKKEESMQKYLSKTQNEFKQLHDWYREIREESEEMMKKQDIKREYYVQKLKHEKAEIRAAAALLLLESKQKKKK